MNKKAFIFDLNGTVIDDMNFHIKAWHHILNKLGANITLEETKLQCYGKNEELLERVFPGRFILEDAQHIAKEKERQYQNSYKLHMKLIPGLQDFFQKAKDAGIPMAIGSAAILFNIDFIIDGLNIRLYFKSIVSADDVVNSKPDPETFLKCAQQLGYPPEDCIVFEDSPKGVEAAHRAGMKSVAITTMHTQEEFYGNNILFFIPDYSKITLEQCLEINESKKES